MVLNRKCFDLISFCLFICLFERLLWLLCEKWIGGGVERIRNDLFIAVIVWLRGHCDCGVIGIGKNMDRFKIYSGSRFNFKTESKVLPRFLVCETM